VACRQVKPKQELVRVVRNSDGSVEVDVSGKKPGRGAYLCRTRECWEEGVKGERLEHALRATLIPENRERLLKYWEDLEKGLNSGRQSN